MAYDHILVATAGEEPGQKAVEEAITLAKAVGATVHAVYVLEVAEPPPWVDDPSKKPGVDTKAGRALDSVLTEATEQGLETDVETAVLRGEKARAIISYATDNDVDLIVIGTHGRTGLDRVVIGSVAEHVVRESPVPVVTVRPD